MNNLPKGSNGGHDPFKKGTRNGRMTSALWSCELHQKISLAATPASLKLETLLVDPQVKNSEDDSGPAK